MFPPFPSRIILVRMMSFTRILALLATCAGFTFAAPAPTPTLPAKDLRAGPPKTLDTPRTFPDIASRSDWEQRAQDIREQVLVSTGLWPLPEKAPLNAKIFGRIERDGYSVEKVYFQTHAGFYLAGNLYRPLGQGKGPFPAILNPHGHWTHGRLEDTKLGAIAGRCIGFARQGMIAFSYDMVGYNDTQFATAAGEPGYKTHRHFGTAPAHQLWNISLMGLQTWNSLRALDFLCSLPDVDKSRLACTGASGGGTQTFMLGAIDSRLAAQAPNVMVSHSMQGGCSCENAPGLRVEFSNMEIAAAAAPRPQILVAAATDWTKTMMTIEGPSVEKVYRLFRAPEKLRYVRLEFDHNYNQPSREQVYGWFGKWLRGLPDFAPILEKPFTKEPDADLHVFPDAKLPPDAVTEDQLVQNLISQYQRAWQEPLPINPPLLERHKQLWLPAWKHTLQAAFVQQGLLVQAQKMRKFPDYNLTELALGRAGQGDRLPAVLLTPRRDTAHTVVILAHPQGKSAFLDASSAPTGLAKDLLARGLSVLTADLFLTGELADARAAANRRCFTNFFTTYNRTDCQERVQDLVTLSAYAQSRSRDTRVILCGAGRAGLWALLAAPAADAVIADCDALDTSRDDALLAPDLFVPGLRRLGGWEGAALLGAPNPLLLHDTGKAFATASLRRVYEANHIPQRYREEPARLPDTAVADWAAQWVGK